MNVFSAQRNGAFGVFGAETFAAPAVTALATGHYGVFSAQRNGVNGVWGPIFWGGLSTETYSGGYTGVFGLGRAGKKIVKRVAKRQAKALSIDPQKNLEELERELDAEGISWQSGYLEQLNTERERLINREIQTRLKAIQDENEAAIIMLLMQIL